MAVDYGPLEALIGIWKGDKGMDIAPDEKDGTEKNPFHETIEFTAVGDVTNAESQTLAVVRYLQKVYHKEHGAQIHDQTGYWLWDAQKEELIHSITIPRGVCVLAGGKADKPSNDEVCITVKATDTDKNYSIVQAPFMSSKAKTSSFELSLTLSADKLHYREVTLLDIYGGKSFEHIDENWLVKV
jgi:hypothetical protein